MLQHQLEEVLLLLTLLQLEKRPTQHAEAIQHLKVPKEVTITAAVHLKVIHQIEAHPTATEAHHPVIGVHLPVAEVVQLDLLPEDLHHPQETHLEEINNSNK